MEYPSAPFSAASVSQDLSKPIVATGAIAAGQVIFTEEALVASSSGAEPEEGFHEDDCDDEECEGCAGIGEEDELNDALDEEEEDQVDPYVVDNYVDLIDSCKNFEALASSDVCKNLFKLLHLYDNDATSIDGFFALPVNGGEAASCMDAAKGLREAHLAVLPTSLNDDKIAHLIGVLNKYSVPLEDVNGSGLFLNFPALKHSCSPNATFTDAGKTICITAIKPIAVGEEITVDMFSTHYMCLEERAQIIAEEGVECPCGVCTGAEADKARAFKCVASGCSGIVHPKKGIFTCEICSVTFDDAAIAAVEAQEKEYLTELEVENYEQMAKIIEGSKLHPFHHIFYTAMEVLSEDSVADENMTEEQIMALMQRQIEAFNYVVDFPHSEKVSLYDAMAQAFIATGDVEKATVAYSNAYNQAKLVFGADSSNTQLFKSLMENPPKSAEEIAAAYGYEIEADEEA